MDQDPNVNQRVMLIPLCRHGTMEKQGEIVNYLIFNINEKVNNILASDNTQTCGLQVVKHDRSKSVKDTCPSLCNRMFSGFKSL